MVIDLKPGDAFVVQDITVMGWLVRHAEALLHEPGVYDHAGMIVDSKGTTLEAGLRFGFGNLYDYTGCKILIVRFKAMTLEAFQRGYEAVRHDIGNLYPWYRLPLFLVGLDKYLKEGQGVCSEMVNLQLKASGIQCQVWGVSPDELGVNWRKEVQARNADIVWYGFL